MSNADQSAMNEACALAKKYLEARDDRAELVLALTLIAKADPGAVDVVEIAERALAKVGA